MSLLDATPEEKGQYQSVQHQSLMETVYKAFLNAALEALKLPLQNLERWSLVTIVLVTVSVMTIIFAAILAIMQGPETLQLLSSASGVVTSVIGGLVVTQLRAARSEVVESRNLLLAELARAGARLFGERKPQLFVYTNRKGKLGKFVKVNALEWNEVAISEEESFMYRFVLSRIEGKRMILKDKTRNVETEIDQNAKKIWWMGDGSKREYLYDIIAIEYEEEVSR